MRKSIDLTQCTEIGYIKKTHGLAGEVMIVFNEGMEETLENLEFLFVVVDGLPVPFFIRTVRFRSDFSANLEFELLETLEKAKELTGCKLYIQNEDLIQPGDGFYLSMLKGFMLMERTMGQIGPIVATDDYGGNLVVTVNYHNREVLIPINEELIVNYDPDAGVLILDLPEGLLNPED